MAGLFQGPAHTECDVLHGPLTDRLLHYVSELQADLIVIGGKRRVLGARLAMVAPCSIAVVPENFAGRLSHILVAVDFSEEAASTLEWAAALASGDRQIACTALHVMTRESADLFADQESETEQAEIMRRIVARADRNGVPMTAAPGPDSRTRGCRRNDPGGSGELRRRLYRGEYTRQERVGLDSTGQRDPPAHRAGSRAAAGSQTPRRQSWLGQGPAGPGRVAVRRQDELAMKTILVVSGSRAAALRGMEVASNLSVACGARLLLAHVDDEPAPIEAAMSLNSISNLTNVMFSSTDWRSPSPRFALRPPPKWIGELRESAQPCAVISSPEALIACLATNRPDLVIASERSLARILVCATRVPVWQIRQSHGQRPWYSIRKLRCIARGARPAEWARGLAVSLGAELEIASTWARDADLLVVAREATGASLQLLAAPAAQPVVVV